MDNENTKAEEGIKEEEVEKKENNKEGEEEQKYTKAEMEEIISKRVAREKKATEKAVAQAEKLAKMNEEEKREFEFQELQRELEEFKKKDAYYGLSQEASKMLKEEGIQADEDILKFVVKDDADETKNSVSAFVDLINRKVEEGVKDALAGNSPKVNTGSNESLTKDDIMKIKDTKKRIKAISENEELFK